MECYVKSRNENDMQHYAFCINMKKKVYTDEERKRKKTEIFNLLIFHNSQQIPTANDDDI